MFFIFSFALIPSFNRVKGTFETRGSKLELVLFSLLNYELIYLSNTVRRVVLKSGLCGKKAWNVGESNDKKENTKKQT